MLKQILLTMSCVVFALPALADDAAAAKGKTIAIEADKRGEGFVDTKVSLKMVLIDKTGTESVREMRTLALEGPKEDGDKSLMIFDTPKDQAGVALLTYTHKQDADDQWLYLPALKRVKKIASQNKSGPFVGSEFAFEDISSQEVEKYTYNYLRDEVLNGEKCFVVERFPLDKNSGYTRQIAWIDQKEYRTLKVDFYDRKNELLKTLDNKDFKQYLNKFWRPAVSFMKNHQTGKATRLEFQNYEFKAGLDEKDFTKNSLTRAL